LAAGCLHQSGSRLPQSKVQETQKEATIMTIVASFNALKRQQCSG
jgi:hypothetical protein